MHDTTNISPWQPQRRKAKKNTSVACLKIDTKDLSRVNLIIHISTFSFVWMEVITKNSVEDEVEPCVHISRKQF